MKNGDISNLSAPRIGFMCEGFLLKFDDSSFGKLKGKLFGQVKNAEKNIDALNLVKFIARDTEYTTEILVHNDHNTQEMREFVGEYMFSEVVLYDKLSQLTSRLVAGDLTYIVDNDYDRLSMLNHRAAVHIDEFRQWVKRNRG